MGGLACPVLSSNQDIFDVRKIRRLVELMKEHDLSEIDLREGETRIQIRRGADPVVTLAGGAAGRFAAAGRRRRPPQAAAPPAAAEEKTSR